MRLINGVSALLLTLLPGKATILEGIQGWELRPTFRGPRFPRWMEKYVDTSFQILYILQLTMFRLCSHPALDCVVNPFKIDYEVREEDSE